MLIGEDDFLNQYRISKEEYDETGLTWQDLTLIYNDYEQYRKILQDNLNSVFNSLMRCGKVHSVRYRTKDPEHLIEKIIRKRIKDRDRVINVDNYRDQVEDLLGFRILHLFKTDWPDIHDFIKNVYDLKGDPVANYRIGDPLATISMFSDKGCIPKPHEAGYRSVHYTIQFTPSKTVILAEIQVRTIFEEGWAEIDHTLRYPYNLNEQLLNEHLALLNTSAGLADEMATFIARINESLTKTKTENETLLEKVNHLEKMVKNLSVSNEKEQAKKDEIEKEIRALPTNISQVASINSEKKYYNTLADLYKNNDVLKNILHIQSAMVPFHELATKQKLWEDAVRPALEAQNQFKSVFAGLGDMHKGLAPLNAQSSLAGLLTNPNPDITSKPDGDK